jgi:MFS family permease
MEPTTVTTKWQIISKFALIFTLILVAINLMLYITDMQTKLATLTTLITFVAIFGAIFKGIQTQRDQLLGGYISYGDGVKLGMLITLFAAILLAIYSVIFVTFIDVDFMDNMLNETKRQMIEQNKSEEEIEMAMKFSGYLKSPWVFAIGGFLGYVVYGLIASLIVSIFTKKEDPEASYNSLQN